MTGGGVLKAAVGFAVGALMALGASLYLSGQALEEQSRLAEGGDFARAEAEVERAALLDPFGATPKTSKGYLELRRGRPEEAARAFEEARDRDPANYANYVSLGNVQRQRLDDPEAAIESYREALERNPNAYTTRPLLGQALLETGDERGAVEQYEWLREHDRISLTELYTLGRLYLRVEEPERAVPVFQSAREQAANGLQELSGQEKTSREDLVDSLDLSIADALVLQGDYAGAREALEASESDQAPSILALLNKDPERYREAVARARVG